VLETSEFRKWRDAEDGCVEPVLFCCGQCSQRSGAPVGPDGGTAKSPGPDGTAGCGPHPSWKPQDGRLCGGRRALQGKTFLAWGIAGDRRGRQGTAGDCGGRPGTANDCRLLPVAAMNPINSIS